MWEDYYKRLELQWSHDLSAMDTLFPLVLGHLL